MRSAFAALGSAALLAVGLIVFTTHIPAHAGGPDSSVAAEDALHVLPGGMIGKNYQPDKFYVQKGGGDWELTYTPGWQGDGFSDQVQGTLPNLRSANGVFDDTTGKIKDYDEDFDAQQNTDDFISHLPEYREHGLMATDVNLQGGNPGYDGADNSAFNSDGSMRQEWFDRAGQVIEASAKQNMVVVLGYFYFGQAGVFDDDDAVRQAVVNATDWLIENNYQNVIIEIANEYNNDSYPDIISSDDGMAELIQLAQSQFDDAPFKLAVSASLPGNGDWPDGPVADAADLALMHCNGLGPSDCAAAAADHQEHFDYPIVVNETDNTKGEYDDETLSEDEASIDEMIPTGASWGYMLNQWNQYAACYFEDDCGATGFDWTLGDDPGANGEGSELLENFAAAVFDHLQDAVYDKSAA